MTFTYNLATPNDITRVRFHLRDTDATTADFSDEEITFQIAETGDWKHGVISCIESKIAGLANDPNFTADWLTVNNNSGMQYYEKLLNQKRQEFGISGVVMTTIYTYRADSNQTASPTFTGFDELDTDDD